MVTTQSVWIVSNIDLKLHNKQDICVTWGSFNGAHFLSLIEGSECRPIVHELNVCIEIPVQD